MMYQALCVILAITLCTTCADDTPMPDPPASDEFVFYNGEIYTVNPSQEWAEAIYVKEGIIEYVGNNEEALARVGENVERIDLEGAFLMPGLHDVHLHPLEAATENFHFIVNDTEEDAEAYQRDIERAARQNAGEDWLLGWGHWINVPLEAERLPKLIIDEVVADRPVAIMEQTSHSVWCNSQALALLGIDDDTPNPPGGIIMRTEEGEANGLLIDNAGNLLFDVALAPTPERATKDYDGLVNYALPELARYGITSIADARTYWQRNHHQTWQKVADDGQLTLRVNLGLWAYPDAEDEDQLAVLKDLYQTNPNSLLQINQVKLYCDGIIHNTTAAMHDDYHIDYFGLPTNKGLHYFTAERIAQYIDELESVGFDFHIHTIGNRGVHEALNAIEQAGSATGRHRLTHVEYVDASDLPRFATLNVTADAQVAGDFTQPDQWHENDYLVDATLNENIVPLKSLQEAGARITLSSDWDVSTVNPMVGLQNAVTRHPQALSLEEAIKAYTINAAYVLRQEDRVGSLEVGKLADFIILDSNIFDIPANEINQVEVEETYLQGQLVYP